MTIKVWSATLIVCAVACHGENSNTGAADITSWVEPEDSCCEVVVVDDAAALDAQEAFVVERAKYDVPDVELVDQRGATVSLRRCLDPGEGVVLLDFVFTTCSTICPVMTVTFSELQHQLQDEGTAVRMVSVSIDPEYDTPAVLEEYAETYDAGNQWTFLTGSAADVQEVVSAFDALFRSKMGHRPFTYMRVAGDPVWTRYEGLGGARPLAAEVRAALAEAR